MMKTRPESLVYLKNHVDWEFPCFGLITPIQLLLLFARFDGWQVVLYLTQQGLHETGQICQLLLLG